MRWRNSRTIKGSLSRVVVARKSRPEWRSERTTVGEERFGRWMSGGRGAEWERYARMSTFGEGGRER